MNELFIIKAGLIDEISGFFSARAFEALGAILLIAVGIITRKYIIPLLKTAHARQTAEHVLTIADDVTDYFILKFPNAHWSNWLDRAVDKIIEVTGVGRGPAERATKASIKRKNDRLPNNCGKIEGRA